MDEILKEKLVQFLDAGTKAFKLYTRRSIKDWKVVGVIYEHHDDCELFIYETSDKAITDRFYFSEDLVPLFDLENISYSAIERSKKLENTILRSDKFNLLEEIDISEVENPYFWKGKNPREIFEKDDTIIWDKFDYPLYIKECVEPKYN